MSERTDEGAPRALPANWLPDPQPPEGDEIWNARARRIVAAAGHELERLEARHSAAEPAWWSVMAVGWKPASVLAVAAAVLLLLAGRRAVSPEPPPGSIPLALIAFEGDPIALWDALGLHADPVLARLVLREPDGPPPPDDRSTIQPERTR